MSLPCWTTEGFIQTISPHWWSWLKGWKWWHRLWSSSLLISRKINPKTTKNNVQQIKSSKYFVHFKEDMLNLSKKYNISKFKSMWKLRLIWIQGGISLNLFRKCPTNKYVKYSLLRQLNREDKKFCSKTSSKL